MKYAVKFKDFLRIFRVGNYVIFYAELDDRVHFEMSTESGVFCSQKFIVNIEEEIKTRADNYLGDPVEFFIKMVCSAKTYYQFYPTEREIEELKEIKLYKDLEIDFIEPGEYDNDKITIKESDEGVQFVIDDKVVMSGMKIK